jgi:His/Glu/Gln/Arg/opine family amino acid ABC transporter permease subunit
MWQNLRDEFILNFIDDNRWQYLTKGLGVTLEVTVFAAILGILLGVIVAIVRNVYQNTGKLKIANALCNLYLIVIRGTPVLVQLLIIYFVIFASVRIDKTLTAIIAFGINSGAYQAEIFRAGIESVPKGQFEAGRSLGFSYKQTMFTIILPQAVKNIIPTMCNEFIALLKETSVAGYIALEDLTKGGDIIRSRTYSAFMPYIAVALIYLVIVLVLSQLVKMIERRLKKSER